VTQVFLGGSCSGSLRLRHCTLCALGCLLADARALSNSRIREAPPVTVPLIDSLELPCEVAANPRWRRRRRQDWCHA
jgi:hypothetical protein